MEYLNNLKSNINMKKKVVKMTELQFVNKWKKYGFELYQTKAIVQKQQAFDKIENIIKNINK